MPRAPDLPLYHNTAYILNYFLAGCSPPQYLMVEFAQDPAIDLALLFLEPDVSDIAQAIVEPGKKRSRKKGRHGRHKKRGRGIPDISDEIGLFIRGLFNIKDPLAFGAGRAAFRVLNTYEGIKFTYAILDGISDVAFANLYGVATVEPDHCQEFSRLSRSRDTLDVAVGGGATNHIVPMPNVEFNVGFFDSPYGTSNSQHDYQCVFNLYVKNLGPVEDITVHVVLGTGASTILATSGPANLSDGEGIYLQCFARIPQDTAVWWAVQRTGTVHYQWGEVVAFADDPAFPWSRPYQGPPGT